MSRLAATLGLLALLAAAGESPLEKLLSDDPRKDHAWAHRVLVREGTPILPRLRAARDAAASDAARDRIDAVIAEIERREPHGLRFQAGVPKMRLTVDLVNSDEFRFAVSVRNRREKPVLLWPYLSLRIFDETGRDLAPVRRIGRWGRRRSECFLDEVPFAEIEPGGVWHFQDGLTRYGHDPDSILGWKIPAPGKYTLELTYRYDRAAVKKRCPAAWKPLHDPAKPWNRALEMEHVFTAEMVVR